MPWLHGTQKVALKVGENCPAGHGVPLALTAPDPQKDPGRDEHTPPHALLEAPATEE
jgi:hypothetical protein